jgi:DNA primase
MAGRIPKQFIDEILLRADIVEVIDARVPLKKAGKDYKACCPFHDEKTASFTVSPAKQFYHCFGCGAHGTAIGFLMEYEHMSFPEAVEELAGKLGLSLPKESQGTIERGESTGELLRILEEAARYYRTQLRESERAIAYLKGRGINGEVAGAFGLGYAPDGWDHLARLLGKTSIERDLLVQAGLAVHKEGGGCYDRFRDRMMFPIHDYRGRIVGFGGRIIDAGEPKYLNSPETALFHKGRELYGLFHARDSIRKVGRVVVVEGYMDVVGLVQYGVDNAVATLGTATTLDHLDRLFRFVPEIVFCFDGDKAGREAAWRALDIVLPVLHEGRHVSFMFLPDGEDPDTLVQKEGKEAFLARTRSAMMLPDFLFDGLRQRVDMGRSIARIQLAELAQPYLSKVPPGLLRDAMLDRLKLDRAIHQRLSVRNDKRIREVGVGPRPPAPIMRLAVALLVQHPQLAAKINDSSLFDGLDLPGIALFRALVNLLKAKPELNTAAVVEHFRDSEHQHSVAKIATWSHSVLEQDVAAEFRGAMDQLSRTVLKEKVELLLQKEKVSGLTPIERGELADLTRLPVGVTRAVPTERR